MYSKVQWLCWQVSSCLVSDRTHSHAYLVNTKLSDVTFFLFIPVCSCCIASLNFKFLFDNNLMSLFNITVGVVKDCFVKLGIHDESYQNCDCDFKIKFEEFAVLRSEASTGKVLGFTSVSVL